MFKDAPLEIKEGDKVELIIGGPTMLVEVIDQDHIIHCIWFSKSMCLEKDRFQAPHLRLIKE
ncbi:MAG: DUF2158 domain-containing protein [Flavobacteriales bacterium]|nr:DUF2158 domain-containing protein [Flavobacteriales bacterium]